MTTQTAPATSARPSWTRPGCCSPAWASPRPTCSPAHRPGRPHRRSPSTCRSWPRRSATPAAAPTAPTGRRSSSSGATDAWTNPPRRRSSSSASTSAPPWSCAATPAAARSAVENFITALRCLYSQAVADGLISDGRQPGQQGRQAPPAQEHPPRRPDARLAEINQVAATTGNDPALDTLLLRLHIETACRRGGALALRPVDLDPDQCLHPAAGEGRDAALAARLAHPDGPPAAPRPRTPRTADRAAAALPQRPADHPPPLRPPVGTPRPSTCPGSPPNRSAPTGCATPP